MRFDFIKKHLRTKLLLLFIAIGVVPLFTLLLYVLYLSQTKIVEKLVTEQFERIDALERLTNNHLASLVNEVKFLSALDVMDDLLVEDIDKRVSRILIQKSKDLQHSVEALCVDLKGKVIASSKIELLKKHYDIRKFQGEFGNFVQDDKVYIYKMVYSSFDTQQRLGYLIFIYNLNDLERYLLHNSSTHTYLVKKNSAIVIGQRDNANVIFHQNKGVVIDDNYTVVYKELSGILQGWYLVYSEDKHNALEFLYDFIHFLLYLSAVIIIAILYASLKYSKDVVLPIQRLTQATQNITATHDYRSKVEVDSKDELSVLSRSFNHMIETTADALHKLEEENKLRLKRFIQLIDLFNTITQTRDEQECIETSIDQIKKLTDRETIDFKTDKKLQLHEEYIELYVTNFEEHKKVYFGSIELGISSFKDENEKKFYDSIGTMITLQLERIRLVDRTMAASRAKSAFISSMSHELRTPLNSIIGFAQYMITCEELSDEQQDVMANIESSSQYLLGMINDILDIAKIEAGKMEVKVQDVAIVKLLDTIYHMLLPLATEKELEFEFDIKNLEIEILKTDPKLFQQVVVNLISNAIKFTQNGTINMRVYNDERYIYVSIEDSGVGIAQEDMAKLFGEFSQLDNSLQKKHQGTGLGLSISKKIAHLIKGEIKLVSEGEGRGTQALFYSSLRV